MLNLSRTSQVLAMEPEVNPAGRVTACYMLIDTSDPLDLFAHRACMNFDLSTENKTLIQRTVIGPVLRSTSHELFVMSGSGLAPLSSWVSV